MTRNRVLIGGLAVLATAAGAGLGLAQNVGGNAVAPAPAEAPPSTAAVAPAATPVVPPPTVTPAPTPSPGANQTEAADNSEADDFDAKKPPEGPVVPPKRPRYTTAVLQALDKVTAETLRFEAKVNEPVRYKDLVITVHACETNASDETSPEAAAHLDVQYQPDVLPTGGSRQARRIYRGWMFANAPGLHPLQHPIYDVWVIACRTPSPAAPPPAGASL